jgi:hypothetical protein
MQTTLTLASNVQLVSTVGPKKEVMGLLVIVRQAMYAKVALTAPGHTET